MRMMVAALSVLLAACTANVSGVPAPVAPTEADSGSALVDSAAPDAGPTPAPDAAGGDAGAVGLPICFLPPYLDGGPDNVHHFVRCDGDAGSSWEWFDDAGAHDCTQGCDDGAECHVYPDDSGTFPIRGVCGPGPLAH